MAGSERRSAGCAEWLGARSPADRVLPPTSGLLIADDRSLDSLLQRMRYTKTALLTFGTGLMLALVVIVTEITWLARGASGLMALGITAIPIGMIVDWRRATKALPRSPKRRVGTTARRVSSATSRRAGPRKSARPNR